MVYTNQPQLEYVEPKHDKTDIPKVVLIKVGQDIINEFNRSNNKSLKQKLLMEFLVTAESIKEEFGKTKTEISEEFTKFTDSIKNKFLEVEWKLDLKAEQAFEYYGEVLGNVVNRFAKEAMAQGMGGLGSLALCAVAVTAATVVMGPAPILGSVAAAGLTTGFKYINNEKAPPPPRWSWSKPKEPDIVPELTKLTKGTGRAIGKLVDKINEHTVNKWIKMAERATKGKYSEYVNNAEAPNMERNR